MIEPWIWKNGNELSRQNTSKVDNWNNFTTGNLEPSQDWSVTVSKFTDIDGFFDLTPDTDVILEVSYSELTSF